MKYWSVFLICLALASTALFPIKKGFLSEISNLPERYEKEFCTKEKTLSCTDFAQFRSGSFPSIPEGRSFTVGHIYAGSTYLYKNLFLLAFFKRSGNTIEVATAFLRPDNPQETKQSEELIVSLSKGIVPKSSEIVTFLRQNFDNQKFEQANVSKAEIKTANPDQIANMPVHIRGNEKSIYILKLAVYPSDSSPDGIIDTVLGKMPLPKTI